MRKALVVGIDHYTHVSSLYGCVEDAYSVKTILERHGDGTINFGVRILVGTGPSDSVERSALRAAVKELFEGDSDIALFYFAGHGHIEATGGYVIASDARSGDEGLPLGEIITLADQSRAKNKVILLDSCHSGAAANLPALAGASVLSEGMTILTASTAEQYATEDQSGGTFTRLLVDALAGAAANLVGDITPGSVYAHIDQSLGSWDQRPVFKTNVKHFISLRRVQAAVNLEELRQIPELFPNPGYELQLDPTFEPERADSDANIPGPDPANTARFAVLQKLNRVNLVVPVDAPHMWHAAMGSKRCKLTALGEHYRRLVERGRI